MKEAKRMCKLKDIIVINEFKNAYDITIPKTKGKTDDTPFIWSKNVLNGKIKLISISK